MSLPARSLNSLAERTVAPPVRGTLGSNSHALFTFKPAGPAVVGEHERYSDPHAMPSSIFQGVFEVLFQAIFEFGCYYAGRVAVPIISFGRWKCDRITAEVPRQKLKAAGLYHRRGQRIYLTAAATQFVGLLSILLVIGAGILIWYLSRR